jgi:hypothetical protein
LNVNNENVAKTLNISCELDGVVIDSVDELGFSRDASNYLQPYSVALPHAHTASVAER